MQFYFNDLTYEKINNTKVDESIMRQRHNDYIFNLVKEADEKVMLVMTDSTGEEILYESGYIKVTSLIVLHNNIRKEINSFFQDMHGNRKKYVVVLVSSKGCACTRYEETSFQSDMHAMKKFKEYKEKVVQILKYLESEGTTFDIELERISNDETVAELQVSIESGDLSEFYYVGIFNTKTEKVDIPILA